MKTNKISEVVSPEVETELVTSIKEAHGTKLPFLVELSPKERKSLPRLNPKYVDFMSEAYHHAISSPGYLPSYLPLEEFTKDMDLRSTLSKVRKELRILDKKLKDTLLLVDSEAYQAARVYYDTVKTAAREGDGVAEIIAKGLAPHYKKKRTKKKSNGDAPANGDAPDNGAEPVEPPTQED